MNDNILTKNQVFLLDKLQGEAFVVSKFYLTGGTALAAFYLFHRYSEDLDFFSKEEFDILSLDVLFKNIQKEVGITKIDFQQSYNRNLFFLHFAGEILKVEFTYFPFPRIESGEKYGELAIDSALDIAVNKLFSIYQRTQARDYIDLYFLHKEKGFQVADLVMQAKSKFDWHIDPMQLGTQLLKVKEAPGYPRMIKTLPDKDLQDFYMREAKLLGKEVIE
jgi:predicted nucleotidyltransferase component of viral defense system